MNLERHTDLGYSELIHLQSILKYKFVSSLLKEIN